MRGVFGSKKQPYPAVNTHADLPDPVSVAGQIFVVRLPTGTWPVSRKRAGLYRSNGSTWTRLGIAPTASELGVPIIDYGRSTSSTAISGVAVSFAKTFNASPKVALAQHQKDAVWIDLATITITGFTWYGDSNNSGIDWIAIGA